MFFEILKKLYWDLSWRQGRYEFWHWLCRDIPGHFGNVVRRCVLKRFFGRAGKNLLIYPGVISVSYNTHRTTIIIPEM